MTINPIGDILKTPLVEIMVAPRYMALIKNFFLAHMHKHEYTKFNFSKERGGTFLIVGYIDR